MLKNKSIISLIIVSSLLAITGTLAKHVTSVYAANSETYDFANFSEKESVDFVASHGIVIPSKIIESQNLGRITKSIIDAVVDDYDCTFAYSYSEMQRYAEDIKEAIRGSYSFSNKNENPSRSTYTLQYNTVKDSNGNWVTSGGAWNSRWSNYNCYAYSIHRNEETPFYSSGFYIQYQPGNMSGTGGFDSSDSICDLATVVKNDLEAIGYTNVVLSTSIPSITNSQELICVRMCEEDYHFMRYDLETNAWYHKPGATAILKYNYVPNNNALWYGEYSVNGSEYSNALTYDSDIYFIKYDKNKISISNSTSNLSSSLYVNQGKDSILEIENSTYNQFYEITVSSSYSVTAELYDVEMGLIDTYSGSNFSFYKSLSNGKYYLKMNYLANNVFGTINIIVSSHAHSYTYAQTEYGHITTCSDCGYSVLQSHVYDQHYCIYCGAYTSSHDYDASYFWRNYTQHRANCVCGANRLEGHAVSSGAFVKGNQYATCLLCGGPASMGFVGPLSLNDLPRSANGSFILPNGVVVLVDEDLDAYLNGTLVFINPNIY